MGGLIICIGATTIATSARVDQFNAGRFISGFSTSFMPGLRRTALRHRNCAYVVGVVSLPRSTTVGLRLWPVGRTLMRCTQAGGSVAAFPRL